MMSLEELKKRTDMRKAVHFTSWYPLLEKAGLKQPKSYAIKPDVMEFVRHISFSIDTTKEPYKSDLRATLLQWCWRWINEAKQALKHDSLFFKLDTYSDKHHMSKTFVETHEDLYERIIDCFYNGELAGVATSPKSLVFREPLDIKGMALLEDSTLPITVERRAFWVDGKIQKVIPYWPLDAFTGEAETPVDIIAYLKELNAVSHDAILPEVEKAGKALENLHPDWSIDFALDAHGEWWLIDCAPVEMSWGYRE